MLSAARGAPGPPSWARAAILEEPPCWVWRARGSPCLSRGWAHVPATAALREALRAASPSRCHRCAVTAERRVDVVVPWAALGPEPCCARRETRQRIPGPHRARRSARAAGRREGKARPGSAAPLLRHGADGGAGTGRGRGARGCTGEAAPRERLWPGPVAQGDGGRWIAVSRGAAPGSVSLPSRRGRVPPRRAHRAVLLVSRKHPNPLAARVPPPSLPAGGPFCPQAQTGSSRAHILLFPSLRAPSGTWRLLIAFQGAESQSAVWMEPQAVPEVGCSLHHPQPRGDLRTAAHTDQLLTVRRAGATGDPCPGGCSPQSHLLGLAKLDWGWLPHCGPALGCTVPAWLLEAGAEGSWNSPGGLGSAERA